MASRVRGLSRTLPASPLYAVEVFDEGCWQRIGEPVTWERVARERANRVSRRFRMVRITCVPQAGGLADTVLPPLYRPRHGGDERSIQIASKLSDRDLARRGLVRAGLGLRAATDEELDRMWRARALYARRESAPLDTAEPAQAGARCVSLALEFKGHDVWSVLKIRGMRPWVARLVGDPVRPDREFLVGAADFLDADELGAEGVRFWYVLEGGETYEIYDRARPVSPRRRRVVVRDGRIEDTAVLVRVGDTRW